MRAVFGLFTALPIDHDPDDVEVGWAGTAVVGVVLGLFWLVFHQGFVRIGGPFVAAGGVLLLHVALTGARPLRGLAGVARAVTTGPDQTAGRGLPGVDGAATAVVTLALLIASSLLIRVDIAPAVLVMVPLIAKSAQALLLGSDDVGVGVPSPSAAQKVGIALSTVVALGIAPLLSELVRPERMDPPVADLGYVVLGIAAFAIAMLVGLLARAWLRARFGALDADGWHAIGAITEVAALAVVAGRIS